MYFLKQKIKTHEITIPSLGIMHRYEEFHANKEGEGEREREREREAVQLMRRSFDRHIQQIVESQLGFVCLKGKKTKKCIITGLWPLILA